MISNTPAFMLAIADDEVHGNQAVDVIIKDLL
jgi:hypothetical protein